jgi:hypothetical protein
MACRFVMVRGLRAEPVHGFGHTPCRAPEARSRKTFVSCSLLSSQRSTVLAASMPGPLRGSLREH